MCLWPKGTDVQREPYPVPRQPEAPPEPPPQPPSEPRAAQPPEPAPAQPSEPAPAQPPEPAPAPAQAQAQATERDGDRSARPALRTALYVLSQVILIGSLFMVYRLGRYLAAGRISESMRNATRVWHLERLLRLPDEDLVQDLALRSTHLVRAANDFYVTAHFPAAIIFLAWVLLFHRDAWSRVRNVLIITTGLALVIHILFPLAPPRFLPLMLPNVHLIDTGAVFGPSAYQGRESGLANQYAAMPSLHIGWAILEAWAVVTISRHGVRWLVLLHPIVTTLVVVATANHYWLDGLIGAVLVSLSVWVTGPRGLRLPRRARAAAP
jgi:hypothetical protein